MERHLVGQDDQALRRGGQVLREPAIRIARELRQRMREEAEVSLKGRGRAQHRLVGAAVGALAAGEPRIDIDPLADLHVGDDLAHLGDDAGRVEADARRQRRQLVPQLAAEDRIHVGNDAAGLDLDKHVIRPRLWARHAVDAQRLPGLMQSSGSHLNCSS
jgi:hypothetical protein